MEKYEVCKYNTIGQSIRAESNITIWDFGRPFLLLVIFGIVIEKPLFWRQPAKLLYNNSLPKHVHMSSYRETNKYN